MSKKPTQIVNVSPLPKGSADQKVHVNPPGGRPPAPERSGAVPFLIIVLSAAVVIVSCGVATALVSGSIW